MTANKEESIEDLIKLHETVKRSKELRRQISEAKQKVRGRNGNRNQ